MKQTEKQVGELTSVRCDSVARQKTARSYNLALDIYAAKLSTAVLALTYAGGVAVPVSLPFSAAAPLVQRVCI